jgi:prevent-host-death family protein
LENVAIEQTLRVSGSDLARRSGELIDEALRRKVVIVQNRGRDTVAIVDVDYYRHLLQQLQKLSA